MLIIRRQDGRVAVLSRHPSPPPQSAPLKLIYIVRSRHYQISVVSQRVVGARIGLGCAAHVPHLDVTIIDAVEVPYRTNVCFGVLRKIIQSSIIIPAMITRSGKLLLALFHQHDHVVLSPISVASLVELQQDMVTGTVEERDGHRVLHQVRCGVGLVVLVGESVGLFWEGFPFQCQ